MVVCVAVYHTTCTYNLESNIEMEVDKAEQNSNTEKLMSGDFLLEL